MPTSSFTITIPSLKEIPSSIIDMAKELHSNFLALGYFEKYGGMCLTVAHLLKNIFFDKGFNAHVIICYMSIATPEIDAVIGYSSIHKDGYIDVHAACIVDNIALLDFAVWPAQDYIGSDFYKCFVVPYQPNPPIVARFHNEKCSVFWAVDEHMQNKFNRKRSTVPYLPKPGDGVEDRYAAAEANQSRC